MQNTRKKMELGVSPASPGLARRRHATLPEVSPRRRVAKPSGGIAHNTRGRASAVVVDGKGLGIGAEFERTTKMKSENESENDHFLQKRGKGSIFQK
jgi:hypothetical protein